MTKPEVTYSHEVPDINVQSVRELFPVLKQHVYNKPLIYFDNGATTQKPQRVIDAISNYYSTYNSNVHRGVHYLSQKATDAMEAARRTVQQYINAESEEEIILTSGTTASLNLLASSFTQMLNSGDEIIISAMEHHANIVPWQMACERMGLKLKVIPIFENGELDIEAFKQLVTVKTKLVSIVHVSNTLGTVNDIEEVIRIAHQYNVPVSIDGAQAIQHLPVDVQKLDCDFYSFSAHKLYGPTGIGILYGKKKWLEQMPPYQCGGEMIKEVTFEKTTFNDLPFKFEAGTPHIAGIIGLAEAIKFVQDTGLSAMAAYENELLHYLTTQLKTIDELRIYGEAKNKISVASFLLKDIHPYDTGVLLDKMGIAVRTGHHCTQPLMQFFNIPGTVRVSLAVYNTKGEIDELIHALHRIQKLF
jgi:cysteine desulfurase/selenocysteine lyase